VLNLLDETTDYIDFLERDEIYSVQVSDHPVVPYVTIVKLLGAGVDNGYYELNIEIDMMDFETIHNQPFYLKKLIDDAIKKWEVGHV